MQQTKQTHVTLKVPETFPTGPLEYRLTNDFLFKAFLQRNKKALRGLLCALLKLKPDDIQSIKITNPIDEGAAVDDKTLILDIKLILNNSRIVNIEMQVKNKGDWEERSLTYLCRNFDQLNTGENYRAVLGAIHIGILDFTPKGFPEKLFSEYYMYNPKTGHIYSDKLRISMLQLNQLGNPEDKEEMPDLYYWAELFHAKTWEEIKMLAQKSEDINDCVVTLMELSADEKIRQQCEAREQYRRDWDSSMEYAQNEGFKNGKIHGTIETLLRLNYPKEEILKILLEQFQLTKQEAESYFEK